MYKTKVTEIGSMAPAFAEELILILFGPKATPELKDLCYIHEVEQDEENPLQEGRKISFGGKEYTILEVGSQANANFAELGHVSVYFRTEVGELLPGAVAVTPDVYPELAVGDEITIA